MRPCITKCKTIDIDNERRRFYYGKLLERLYEWWNRREIKGQVGFEPEAMKENTQMAILNLTLPSSFDLWLLVTLDSLFVVTSVS